MFRKVYISFICWIWGAFCTSSADCTTTNDLKLLRSTPQSQIKSAIQDSSDDWVESTIAAMTLREKIGQMMMINLNKSVLTPADIDHLKHGAFGNVILFSNNISDHAQTRTLTRDLQNLAIVNHGIPMLIAVDQEGGLVNRLGQLTNLNAMKYSARTVGQVYAFAPEKAPKLIQKATKDIAIWLKDLGFNMNMAPVLDLTDDKNSYIYSRSYGSNPSTVSMITRQYAKTMTGQGIISTGKHFPNLSTTTADSHKELPILARSLRQLRTHEFLPFKTLREDLPAIMIGHVKVPAVDDKFPASMSPKVIRLLREEIGFEGLIVSDDLKMRAVSENYSLREIVIRSVFAGVDLLVFSSTPEQHNIAIDALYQAVSKGVITISQIDRAVRRILVTKSRFAR